MELIANKDLDIMDIVEHADTLPEEVVAAALQYGRDMAASLREINMRLEGNLITRMKAENATKQIFKNAHGEEMVATLRKGSVKCDTKDADIQYKKFGFDPLEIGEYVFKPSWTKAKEAKKFGGEKSLVIDELFKESKDQIVF